MKQDSNRDEEQREKFLLTPDTSFHVEEVSLAEQSWPLVSGLSYFSIKRWGKGFPGGPGVENLPANAGDMGLIPGLGRFHLLWSSLARVPQLLSPSSRAQELQLLSSCAATSEAHAP